MSELRFGLKESAIAEMNGVFTAYPEVERVMLYGSRAMGRQRNGSDIDLTIVGDAVTHTMLLRIANQLDDLLLPYKIDLSLLRQIENPDLLDHIQRVGVLFFERDVLVKQNQMNDGLAAE
ncbi:MAG: nucleotidyltransferase domain-containing protein [Desulfuromonadaceae bacterium]|nr:nucleotidyltransferase domain-containing protein [Desulfuromonadaceae bacterium]